MNIDKFSEFFESYNTPVGIKWIDKNYKLIGLFMVNNKVYQITCTNNDYNIWTYKFHFYDNEKNEFSPELTNFNTGKLSILSTIRVGMEYLINNKNPNGIIFGALDSSDSRKKLYWTYSTEIKDKYNYERLTQNIDNKQIFILYKEIDKEILFDKIKEIIENEIDVI
jgi:hypothetical protein